MQAIRVENVSKRFILKSSHSRSLKDGLHSLFSRIDREDLWAVRDVCFEVEQGEALGIIGHNGAGKSTMLKLLTRIMEPTTGKIRTRGRVSALIEVGAGFHPEMTGRENIYLNGSILGMGRQEINAKFDDIVSFAELERFIDTPVKRYSSGMYARLGFAVAAHVEPEVLIVDEVLSVGDTAFQRRCHDHMTSLRSKGCTIVFVSHNLQAVASLCNKGIVMASGRVHFVGAAGDAVQRYSELTQLVDDVAGLIHSDNSLLASKTCSRRAVIKRVWLEDESGSEVYAIKAGDAVKVKMEVEFGEDAVSPIPSFYIRNSDGILIYDTTAVLLGVDCGRINSGESVTFDFAVESLPLKSGNYNLTAEVAYGDLSMYYDSRPNAVTLYVHDSHTSDGILELPASLKVSRMAGSEAK